MNKTSIFGGIMDIVLWVLVGSIFVLVIMNPGGFSQDVTSVGGFVTGESKILTGSGYVKAK